MLDAETNSAIGAGSRIGIGNSNGDGTFEYTGGATETNRQIVAGGGTLATHTGDGTFLNNGTGAVTFDNAAFNVTQSGTITARTLTLGGSYAGINTISGVIADNDSTSGIISLEKIDAASTWRFDGVNTYTGTTTVTAGTLLINGDQSAAIGAVTVASSAVIGGTGTIGGATARRGASTSGARAISAGTNSPTGRKARPRSGPAISRPQVSAEPTRARSSSKMRLSTSRSCPNPPRGHWWPVEPADRKPDPTDFLSSCATAGR